MKKVKEPAPHVKAAQIEKEAVRALSVDEVEEALTKSTYGGAKKDAPPLDETAGCGDPEALVREISRLNECIEVLKVECLDLKEERNRALREIDDYKKTISKMQYAHEEEVRALEDELAEAKILAKKRGEAVDELDECCVTFSKIRFMANTAVDMAASLRKIAHMIEEEAEEHC